MGEVKGLKVKSPKTAVALSMTGPQTWGWVGKPDFRVRGDRVEKLLRDLHIARAKNFLEPPPKNLTALDLVPDRRTEITVATSAGDRTLWLGARRCGLRSPGGGRGRGAGGCNPGRRGQQDPQVFRRPPPVAGAIAAVHQVVWGPPGKTWTARKDQGTWKITGPDQAATQQPAVRLELALWIFQKLEAAKKSIPARRPRGSPVFELKLLDQEGKPLLHLEELGANTKPKAKTKAKGKGKDKNKDRDQDKDHLVVRIGEGKTSATVLIAREPFRQWQAEMQRLTAAAEPAGPQGRRGKPAKAARIESRFRRLRSD